MRTLSSFLFCIVLSFALYSTNAVPRTSSSRLTLDENLVLASPVCDSLRPNPHGIIDPAYIDPSLNDRLAQFLDDLQSVAGLSVVIVRDTTVIYLQSFGYQNLERCEPLTQDSRFYLKSTTKSFLGVLAAKLHEDGVVELDAPITEYLPELSPPDVNADRLTLRSHLTHGMPYFDAGLNFVSAFVGMDEDDYVDHVNTYGRPKDTRFQYSNFGPIMAGHALSEATGRNWRDLMKQHVFGPLGMENSTTYIGEATEGPIATVYAFGEETRFTPTPLKVDAQMHAAGGAVSTTPDMARWLIASLNDGRIDGRQALPARAFQQAHARQINMDWTYYKFHRFAHGFGHYSADYEGDLLMHHFGGETHMSFMPEHNLGIAVLSNQIEGGSITTHRVAALLYDTLLGKADLDERWRAASQEISDGIRGLYDRKARRIAELIKNAPDAEERIPPSSLEGMYHNARIGTVELTHTDEGVRMRYGALTGSLNPVRGNAYLAYFMPWGAPPELFVFERAGPSQRPTLDWGGRIFEP